MIESPLTPLHQQCQPPILNGHIDLDLFVDLHCLVGQSYQELVKDPFVTAHQETPTPSSTLQMDSRSIRPFSPGEFIIYVGDDLHTF